MTQSIKQNKNPIITSLMERIDLEVDMDKLEHMSSPLTVFGYSLDVGDDCSIVSISLSKKFSIAILHHMAWYRELFENDICTAFASSSQELVVSKISLYDFRIRIKQWINFEPNERTQEIFDGMNKLITLMLDWKESGVDSIEICGKLSINCNNFKDDNGEE